MRETARRAGGLAAVAVLCGGLLDGAAWLLLPPPMPFNPHTRFVEETPYLSGSPRFTVVTNNYGFRNGPDFSFPLRADRPRLLLVGDSIVFGGPNDGTIDVFLSRLLPGHDVINGGAPGADLAFYADMVRHYLPRIRPQRVVVGLFLGNDFSGPLAEQRAAARYRLRQLAKALFFHPILLAKRLRIQRGARVGQDVVRPLSRQQFRQRAAEDMAALCGSLCLDETRHLRWLDALDLDGILARHPGLQCEQGVKTIVYAAVYREHLAESLLLRNENALRNYADALATIRAIRGLAAAQGGPEPVFALFPVSFMLEARYAAFYRDLGYEVPQASARYPLRDRVVSDLRAGGYTVLDLHAALAGRAAFFEEDWHLNEDGNQTVAAEIARWVESASATGPGA